MANTIAEVVMDDKLILEARFKQQIWDTLWVACGKSNGERCNTVCSNACPVAESFIDKLMLIYWLNYVRLN